MIFINTHKASPVANGIEAPNEYDYFNLPFTEVNNEFLDRGEFVIDEAWWHEQFYRCVNGVYIPNGIAPGNPEGEESALFVDGVDAIWSNNNRDCYLPEYDLMMKDRMLYIPGRMYFYLNFWWIKGASEDSHIKDVIHPRFTDLSWRNWITREAMIRFSKDNAWFKARQKGLSEEAACDIGYEYLFLPNSQSVIMAYNKNYSETTALMVFRGLDMLKNTQFYKEAPRGSDRMDYKKNKVGSEIWVFSGFENTQKISGKTPSLTYIEEVGVAKAGWTLDVRDYIKPSISNTVGDKIVVTGRINYIGTGGEVEDGIQDMERMFYSPDEFDLLSFKNRYKDNTDTRIAYFVDVLAFKLMDKWGNSRISSSEKIEDELRERLTGANKFKHIILNPKNPDELFNLNVGGFFGAEIIQWANERKADILNNKALQKEFRYRLDWKDPKNKLAGVEAVPYREEDGEPLHRYNVYISEPPELNGDGSVIKGLYYQGTDSYDQTEAKTSTSKGASIIWKGFNGTNKTYNKPVALLLERPSEYDGGREKFYENTAKLAILYGTKNMIEHSKILIFNWYENNGFAGLLALKPELTIATMVIKTQTSNRYGLDSAVIPEALTMLRDRLTHETVNRIDSVMLLNAIALFRIAKGYNCDLTIAMALAVVQYNEEVNIQNKNREVHERQNRSSGMKYKSINGRIVMTR